MTFPICISFMFILLINGAILDNIQVGRGLLVIPGLGSPDRLSTVIHNIQMLKRHFTEPSTMDCIIYVYAPRNITRFWSRNTELDELSKYCDLVDNPNGRVTANLYLLQPIFVKYYSFIFILLDDCKLMGDGYFPLDKVLKVMAINQLTVASPRVS